jgi:peptidoglycan/xylan/chitin deacetylase (PgdA/CDA1 family)
MAEAPRMTDSASQPASSEAVRISAGPRSTRAVALTFDDGYDTAACASIGRTLRAYGAVGTFFINGLHLMAEPRRWQAILRGQQVGNHTRSHRRLTEASDLVVQRQIMQNEALHERILGRPMLKVLRPPYGAHDRRVRGIAGALGYQYTVLWSVDARDWQGSATVRSIIDRATGAPPGSIILMHCGPRETPAALASVIRHYRSRGIALAGLDVVLGLDAAASPSGGPEGDPGIG